MTPSIPQRILRVQAPMIPVVGEMVQRHPGTISLGQGVVHYAPPPQVDEALRRAVNDPRLHRYGLAFGIDELLAALTAKLAAENGIVIGSNRRVAVTAGSNMAFQEAILAIADPGDEVILLAPFYFNHEMAVEIAGCRALAVPTDANYQPRLDVIAAAITPRTRAVVTVSPNNPTGTVYPEATLGAINALCRERGIYHLHDEAYEYFHYAGASHFSPGSIPGSEAQTISFFSFSKAYGMAGWRIGYLVLPAHLEEAIKKIQDTNLICPSIVTQLAATAALSAGKPWIMEQARSFPAVRDIVLGELAKLGDRITVPTPGGAFYAMLRVATPRKDMEVVEQLIREFGVAVMPGSTFGLTNGCYLRVAYGALSPEAVAEGIGRLVRGLAAI